MWQGQEPINNILLWSEQGLGDSIQFIRFANLLQKQGIRVTIAPKQSLIRLFQECLQPLPVAVIDQDQTDLTSYKVHASLMSLPRILKITLANLPAEVPYIHPSGVRSNAVKSLDTESFKIDLYGLVVQVMLSRIRKDPCLPLFSLLLFKIYYNLIKFRCGAYKWAKIQNRSSLGYNRAYKTSALGYRTLWIQWMRSLNLI